MTRRMAGSSASRLTSWSACIMGFDNPAPMGHGETGGNVSAPVVREFFKIALADQPPIPFRAPPGIKLVRVNLKTGLPAGPGDPKAIMEAFKPTQEPLGAVATDTEGDAARRVRPGCTASSLPRFRVRSPDRRPRRPFQAPGQRPGFDIGHRRTLLEANNSETCRRDLAILAARSAISRSEEEMRAETEAVVNDIKQSLTLLRRHL